MELKTASEENAGTDANVYFQMMGEEGESQDIELKNKGGGYFNRGQLDRFRIRAKDVGRVSEFYLRGRGFTPLIWLYSTYGYDVLAVWSQMHGVSSLAPFFRGSLFVIFIDKTIEKKIFSIPVT